MEGQHIIGQAQQYQPHHTHHHHVRCRHISSGEEQEEEELDPRIQVELEKLNKASEEINRLELELDDARASFRQVLSDSTQCLNGLAKKLGSCVDKARPYYESRMKLKEAHVDSQKAAIRFERACSMHEAAKEMVQLAEEGYKRREQDLDPTWQEMLNHATMKVNDAERERIESEEYHQRTTLIFKKREDEVQKYQKDLKRSITKSKAYFEMKAKFNQVMEDHKRTVSRLEDDVSSTKALYSQALRSLEAISDDIHRQRLERHQKLQLGVRGTGVGAESPSPPPSWEKGSNMDGSPSSLVFDSDGDDEIFDVNYQKHTRSRGQGIVGHDLPYRNRTSISDTHLQKGDLKTDPLNVVVFKAPSAESNPVNSSKQFPSSPQTLHARNASYVAAIDASMGADVQQPMGQTGEKENRDGKEELSPATEDRLRLSASLSSQHSSELTVTGYQDANLPGSPRNSRKRDMDRNHSSISRAQEWVNKSPVPQQRRFVKSKSLIDASSPTLTVGSPSPGHLSASLTGDTIRGMMMVGTRDDKALTPPRIPQTVPTSDCRVTFTPSDPIDTQTHRSPSDGENAESGPGTMPNVSASQNSPRSRGSTPERSSPLTGSPSTHRKSPKLQGLILKVDAAGIGPAPPKPSTNHGLNTNIVISTQHPNLGIFKEAPHTPSSSSASVTPTPATEPVMSKPSSLPQVLTTSAAATMSSAACATSSSSSSLTHLPRHLALKSPSKVSSYHSKTSPATLSTSYRLPPTSPQKISPLVHQMSPTGNSQRNTSIPVPALAVRQTVSPVPMSPSFERFSISGRSDSLSSHRSGLLKVPSDSSDTESIASTGPMLDDDQVEFLAMDFSEQSITTQSQEDEDISTNGISPASIHRGGWARMSLPPRLSYLEGFIERAKLTSGNNVLCRDNSNEQEDLGNEEEDERTISSVDFEGVENHHEGSSNNNHDLKGISNNGCDNVEDSSPVYCVELQDDGLERRDVEDLNSTNLQDTSSDIHISVDVQLNNNIRDKQSSDVDRDSDVVSPDMNDNNAENRYDVKTEEADAKTADIEATVVLSCDGNLHLAGPEGIDECEEDV